MVGSVRPKSEPNSYPPSVAVLGSSFSQKRKPSGLSSLESYTDCIHEDEPWPSSHSASLNRREPSPPEHDQSVRLGLPDEGDATSSVFEPRRDPIVMMNRYQSSVDQGPLITSFSSNNKSQVSGLFICECCPQKPKKFGTSEELQVHETGKQYKCAYCPYRFRNKNEAERHQNSFHLHRQSWSCAALAGYESAFHRSTTDSNIADTCCYCGEDFPRTGTGPEGPGVTDQDWDIRVHHLQEVHKFGECDHAKKFYRADHFRQHLKHNHAGTTGKWTNMLENACMRDELLPNPILEPRALRTESLLNSNEVETGTTMPGAAGDLIDDTDTYTCFSKDSGYYSMVSKAQRKPANEGGDSLQWETGSIASIRSLATMDTISSVSPAAVGGAAEELAEMLVKDDLISKLIVDGYKNIGAVRFERNFRRILKNFAFGLRTEARNELEKSAIRLVHNYRAYIIILIKDRLELADGSHVTTLEELQQQKQSKLALERFLGNIAGAEDIGNADLGEGNDSGSDIDSDVSDSEQSYLPTLEKPLAAKSGIYSESMKADRDIRENEADTGEQCDARDDHQVRSAELTSKSVFNYPQFGSANLQRTEFAYNAVLNFPQYDKDTPSLEDYDLFVLQKPSPQEKVADGRAQDLASTIDCLSFSTEQQFQLLKSSSEMMPQQAQEPRHGWLEEVLLSLGPWLAWGPYFTSRLLLRLHNWWVRSRRKPLAKGYSRIEWECACGHHLFADFNNKSQDLLNKYTAILKRAPQGTSTNTTSQSPSDDLVSPPAAHTQRPNASGMSRQNTYIPGNLSQASTLTSAATTNDPHLAFLELCVNTGPHLKSLAEIDTKNISTDGMLFQNIKNQYLRLRGFRSRFWLLKPASISFVRFSLENRHRVGILQKPLALPPKSEVDAKKWIYDPCPLDGDPPIPENLFLHYLQCSEPSGMLFWMLRFPRKLETSLLNTMAPASFGWGIHIDEGPNFAALFKANFVVLLLSGLAAGLWCLFEHDFQGGFGFACWIIAVLNSLLMAYMFKWRQE